MTFVDTQVIPDPDQAVLEDTQGQFDLDVPFGVKQATISTRRHRWYQVIDIGTPTGPYAVAPGLTAGSIQRIQFDNRPDYVIVTCSGDTATTGRIAVYRGEAGGPFIRLGQGGKVIMPAPQDGVITIVSRGTTTAYGTVIGVAGWQIGLDLAPGL
jgi:hypothetical protein